jgi:amino acid adenylation domain-containing protein
MFFAGKSRALVRGVKGWLALCSRRPAMAEADLIHTKFEAQALRRPDSLAVSGPDGVLTYAELEQLSRAAAGQLAAAEGRRGVVAILAERGVRTVVAALACARAGRPFAILDLAYPAQRLTTLIEICRPELLLLAGPSPDLPGCGLPTIEVDLARTDDAALPLPTDVSPDDPAYLLFTSGSTGVPKCIACSHRPLAHFVEWQALTFALGEDDRFSLLSGLSHDPVLRDIFTPLSLGASIHIPTQATITAPGGLLGWFAEVQPTVAHMTPPMGQLLTAAKPGPDRRLGALRYVFWGGDVLRRSLVEATAALAPECESVNFYGSTETPQAASFYRVPAAGLEARAPIGVGIDGFELEMRDGEGGLAPDDETGEIVVRSRFLTLGYVQNGQLPPARPFGDEGCYATGDIGQRGPDGQVAIQGRRDDQVKIRGYRVELGEITACALTSPRVDQAITLNVGDARAVRLCCFVQPGRGAFDAEGLRARFARRLPAYMAPDQIVALTQLPLLPNGKIDRQALITSQIAPSPEPMRLAALTRVEAELVEGWRNFFRSGELAPASSFASLGGDSLSYVSAYLSLEQALGRVPDNWTTMTIVELAALAEPMATRGPFIEIETAILLRAAAISIVVGSHFQLFFSGGAGTSALLWVSGCIFGNLQLREMAHGVTLKPIWRLLKSILLPLYLIELPQFAVKVATHYHPQLSSILLFTDLIDYTGMPISGPDAYHGHEYYLWYIHAVVHIVIAYGLLMLFSKHVLKLRRPALVSAFAAVAVGLAGRFLLPTLLAPEVWTTGVDPVSYFNHAPTTHLATFALAALSGFAGGRWRAAILAASLLYVGLSVPIYGVADSLPIAAVAGLLFMAPKLSVPRVLSTPIYLVAGASFFIYLLQFKFLLVAEHLHLSNLAAWPLAVAGGVAAWSAWNWGSRRIGSVWQAWREEPRRFWRLREQNA